MRKLTLFAVLAVCSTSLLPAQERFDAEGHAKVVAPLVDAQTVFVAHLDLSRIDVGAIFKLIKATGAVPEKELELSQAGAEEALKKLTQLGVKHVYAVRSLAGGPTDFCAIVPLDAGVQRAKLVELLKTDLGTAVLDRGNAIIAGPPGAMKLLENLRPSPRPEIAQALAAAGDGAIQAAVVVPTSLRRALLEMMPNLPKELDAASMTILTKGLLWIALKIDTRPQVAFRLLARSQDKSAAEDLNRLIGKLIALGKNELQKQMPEFEKMLDLLTFKVQDDTLIATLTGDEFMRATLPLVQRLRDGAKRAQGKNDLKQIAIAMHNYYATNKGFPTPANYDKNGKELLSWRVHLLPYLDHNDLYKQFKLDEPWDSAHNKKLIPLMPRVYRAPELKRAEKGLTVYLVPVGPTTIFPGKNGVKFQEITDGTSNTILIVEAAEASAVVWTKPEDWKFDPKNPTAGLVDPQVKSFIASMADGSVRTISRDINAELLSALFTRNGGEVIELP